MYIYTQILIQKSLFISEKGKDALQKSYEIRADYSDVIEEPVYADAMAISKEVLDGQAIVSDKALSVRFSVRNIGANLTFLAVNGVAQVGESSNRQEDEGRVLTRFSKLDIYEGFPLDYSILVGQQGIPSARGNLLPLAISRVSVDDSALEVLLTEAANETEVQDEKGNEITLLPSLYENP